MRHLILDGLNVFIRAFTVVPTMDINGEHVGGTTGFLLTLNKLVRETRPDNIFIIWDGEGGSWKRRSIYKDYKAGRKMCVNREYDFEDPEDNMKSMRRQIALTKEILECLPITQMTVKGVEADDVIAYLWGSSIPKIDTKIIVSSDKDYYQLLDSTTTVYTPTKKKFYSSEDLQEEMKILPENFIYMKAITGDNSDNIPGIKGIGIKTTIKLFPVLTERVVEVEDIFKHCEENKNKKSKYELVLNSRELVINNIKLMQLSSPFMDPNASRTIRECLASSVPRYKPTDLRLKLIRDGLQIKAGDFFTIFKEQFHRTTKRQEKINE
ncbi:hypothetical protein KAT92_05115 [Candidatus Babeliales bacterium]|nr:hypothetical protein [Candidatus Babeliales bacterium]